MKRDRWGERYERTLAAHAVRMRDHASGDRQVAADPPDRFPARTPPGTLTPGAAMTGHNHDLDGTLHNGCPMCDEILSRLPNAHRDRIADQAMRAHQERAERTSGR